LFPSQRIFYDVTNDPPNARTRGKKKDQVGLFEVNSISIKKRERKRKDNKIGSTRRKSIVRGSYRRKV
jgi:hypothetical protein